MFDELNTESAHLRIAIVVFLFVKGNGLEQIWTVSGALAS